MTVTVAMLILLVFGAATNNTNILTTRDHILTTRDSTMLPSQGTRQATYIQKTSRRENQPRAGAKASNINSS